MVITDFLIVGGGIVGVTIARELKVRWPDAKVLLIEKESALGEHASGRNSGVLHAGFYYSADSLKARFCRQGNLALTGFCEENGLRINRCGKLVVARDPGELPALDELLRRAQANQVPLQDIGTEEARAIEPRVKTCQRALFSPTTASVDPGEVLGTLAAEARAAGVGFRLGECYLKRSGRKVVTDRDTYEARYVVNAAGLYADRLARDYGYSENYRILPFKGLYLYSLEPAGSVRTHVYPVPDLKYPFLGVHYTLAVDGRIKIGPTAIPAFWREQYQGLERFSVEECLEVLSRQAGLFFRSGFDFKQLAVTELRKYSKARLAREAGQLLSQVRPEQFAAWGRPGIRAQLLDIRAMSLEMDFVLEGDGESMHVLNAVSPAFTCSIPFARHVCGQIAARINA